MKRISDKMIAFCVSIAFTASLVPILLLTFINRAAGDDYHYAALTRQAWVESGSLFAVIQAGIQTVNNFYYSWQGTWFSIFLFSMQPEVFHEKAYIIVVFIMLFAWIGSTLLLFHEIMVKRFHFTKSIYIIVTLLFLAVSIQYIPGTKSSIFWYNGGVHYMIPFVMCQILLYSLIKYSDDFKKKYLVLVFILLPLLGGSNYQAALLGILLTVFGITIVYLKKRNLRCFLLLIPLALAGAGLIISMKSPGNKVRGGENFGFHIDSVIGTVLNSFIKGIADIGKYIIEKPIIFIIFIVIIFFIWKGHITADISFDYPKPLLFVLITFCIYCAMQAPEIYSGVEVSGGVYNMNYQVFTVVLQFNLIYILGWTAARLKKRKDSRYSALLKEEYFNKYFFLPCIVIVMLLTILCRSNIKDSTFWICTEYMISGQAGDYREQMELQTALFMNQDTENVVVPFINNEQGPLMHMPITANPEAWTNTVTAEFYGKSTVVAMPRNEWENLYQ